MGHGLRLDDLAAGLNFHGIPAPQTLRIAPFSLNHIATIFLPIQHLCCAGKSTEGVCESKGGNLNQLRGRHICNPAGIQTITDCRFSASLEGPVVTRNTSRYQQCYYRGRASWCTSFLKDCR